MENNEQPNFESFKEESFAEHIPLTQTQSSQEIEQLLTEKAKKFPARTSTQSQAAESTGSSPEWLEGIFEELKGCEEQISQLAQQIAELKAAEKIIIDLSNRNKDLNEQLIEREIILPTILRLIYMADNCREQIGKFQKICDRSAGSQNEAALKILKFTIETRKANLTEFEDILANMAVESYQHHEDIFSPSLQKCINRVECAEQSLQAHIAGRLRPGYMRNGKIVRKECVDVYVLSNKINNLNNGGN